MFGRKKKVKKTYDRENKRPVLRCSICNGEQVAGFKDIHTGGAVAGRSLKGGKLYRTGLTAYLA